MDFLRIFASLSCDGDTFLSESSRGKKIKEIEKPQQILLSPWLTEYQFGDGP
jgi:hypothetical protein